MKKYLSYILIAILIIASVFYWDKEEPVSFGVVGSSNLTNGIDVDGGSSSTTASISPTGNNLILISVVTRTNITADPNEPTISGNGLTWVLVNSIVFDTTSASRKRISVFRAMGSSPSSGAVTIDFAGQAQTDTTWSVSQFSGTDTSGTNGSGAIVQSATGKDETGASSSFSVTLGAFSSVNNATYGAFGADGTASSPATAGSGFAILGQNDTGTAAAMNIADEYKSTNDTGVDISWSAVVAAHGGVAIEIKEAVPVVSGSIESDLVIFD